MKTLFIAMFLCMTSFVRAQDLLSKPISLNITNQRLDHVLEVISHTGNFYFSYNSNILKSDSLVTLKISDQSVQAVLTKLLGAGFEFRQTDKYIIIRRAPIQIKLVTSSALTDDKFYTINGYVLDEQTGERVKDASVYERNRLSVVNTNENGYFKIRLKSKYKKASISVSKEYYEDTTVVIEPKHNQQITVTLIPMVINEKTIIVGPAGYEVPEAIELEVPIDDRTAWLYRYAKTDSQIVEKTTVGKWLVSSKQKIQSINLSRFFVARPYQVSFTPGLSTNGKMNGQVVNNFSFNVLGGYSGGTNGFEIGGLFNIDKKDVKYVQIAGLFNTVGGDVKGVQVGGVTNTILGEFGGVQIGGVTNVVKRDFRGFQIGGVNNVVAQTMKGLQIGGVANFVSKETKGVQVGGVANIVLKKMSGVQIGGILNYSKNLKGVQIGLINIADTSDGYSIGLINIVFKGYHKLSFSTNELINLNASFKTGNRKLYSIFLGGYNTKPDEKVWSYGYGIGAELTKGKKLILNTELTSQYLYLGSWEHYNILNRANLHLQYRVGKMFSVFAGPVYSVYVSNQQFHVTGYKRNIHPTNYSFNKFSDTVTGWIGWTAGINIF